MFWAMLRDPKASLTMNSFSRCRGELLAVTAIKGTYSIPSSVFCLCGLLAKLSFVFLRIGDLGDSSCAGFRSSTSVDA